MQPCGQHTCDEQAVQRFSMLIVDVGFILLYVLPIADVECMLGLARNLG